MSHIQAILFSRDLYDTNRAKRWLSKHKFSPIKRVHITTNWLRYRIREPEEDTYEYRMKVLSKGIKTVIGFLPYALYE